MLQTQERRDCTGMFNQNRNRRRGKQGRHNQSINQSFKTQEMLQSRINHAGGIRGRYHFQIMQSDGGENPLPVMQPLTVTSP